ncbi:hypothetical protein FNW52_18840 [Flavobacterium sp. ZT3R18]|uniref:hypothetical protein n=1 Tax=Flavobacterium sp. ZT3R18 TaxID=2594429 RepID=UPI00117AAA25|nr:hypothetical protein [Flavobacterium sp. ZT3R18]TRX31273.1 hypothetical protein FNW52_18840 [Flavobacterium sp. ZT3R18]
MKKYIVLLFLFSFSFVSAQRFDIIWGKMSNLKGIPAFNVIFDYTNLQVEGFETEEAFLADKMEKRKDFEGKPEKFKKDWFENRENKYEPKFIESFNKRFDKGEIKCDKDRDLKYTMNIKTTWIYPGYNLVEFSQPAKISATITVIETANPDNILLVIKFDKSIGLAQGIFEFDEGYRIAGAYEKLAKNMTMQLKRFL